MGDCRPTTSGRDELSEKEKQVLGGFWVYVQPMSLYRHIQQRQRFQASFLRRSLTYHKPKPLADFARCTELSMILSLESEDATCSVFVIVCKKIHSVPASGRKSAMAFEPLSAQLLKLGKSPGHDSSAVVKIKVHYQHQHQSAQLGVMLLAAGDPLVAHLLDALKKKTKWSKAGTSGFSLTTGCTLDKAFGLIPSGDAVFWHFTELPARWDLHLPLKLKARLRKGMMRTVAGGTGCVLQLTSQAIQGPIFDMQLGLQTHNSTRPTSAGSSSCSHSSGRGQAGSTDSHTSASKPIDCGQEHDRKRKSSTVHFCYYFHNGLRHVKEATTNFTCFACKQTCNGLLGLQQHIEASHDFFNFGYFQGEADAIPTVNVRCPGELYDQQGTLQNPEADDIGDGTDCKEIYFECRSKKLRALKLQQYGMTDKERASLPACLTSNQFNKAAWKSWHARMYEDEQRLPAQAMASSASRAHSPPPLPLRPFLAKPHPPTCPQPHPNAPGTSHAEATASTSINHSTIPMPASSAAANGGRGATARAKTANGGDDDAATASAKTGKPPVGGQRQVQSRKRGRPPHHASGSQERPAPVYFHARSCSRMTPQEVSHIMQDPHAVTDSDDEADDRDCSKARVVRQLDRLTGLSAAEKNLMLSWNMYLHDHPCLADAQMGQRCIAFAAEQVQAMRADSELRRCFMVHLVNLWEFNIVTSDLVDTCMVSIDAQS
ncbi:hypothetical protein WJX77_010776 [Trebouxia sp. C0004]